MTTPKIIALTGYKQSGKSTVAGILEQEYGFTRMAFTNPVKRAVQGIYDLSDDQLWGDLKEIVDPRYDLTPRFIMQNFGTEVCRAIHPETWVIYMARRIQALASRLRMGGRFVIEDLRFENEAQAVHNWGGTIWRIDRPGFKGDKHASEQLPETEPDVRLWNGGDVEALELLITAEVRTW